MGVYLLLETFAGGTAEEAIDAAVACAQKIGVWVKLNLNGVTVLIHPSDSGAVLVDHWRKAMERGVNFCSANVVPNK